MSEVIKPTVIPVILSGGAGTRLWPVSREANPKPFMALPDGESLLKKTYLRAINAVQADAVLTVTNREYYFRTKDEYAGIELSKSINHLYLLEPEGRNTAPAIAMAAFLAQEKYDKDAILLVMPADHLIKDDNAFKAAVEEAIKGAMEDHIVTFGIAPTRPDTGYGYIEMECSPKEMPSLYARIPVSRFVEKPSYEKAKSYLEEGRYVWNSGIFCFKASIFLKALQNHANEWYLNANTCFKNMGITSDTQNLYTCELKQELFSALPSISVDYAVMEKEKHIQVIPCDMGWSDVGSWDAVSELVSPDEHGNRVNGMAALVDVKDTYIQSEGRLIAALGVENLVIIETDDAVLVANRENVQDVRKIVGQLKQHGQDLHKFHRTVHRPWGTFTVLEEGAGFKIKRIVVKPKQRLSLQMHHHRSEHWIVVRGMAKIVNGEKTLMINTNESTYIPAGHAHRLENPGVVDLVLIEVQSGEYLGEDDIIRFDDQYGRV